MDAWDELEVYHALCKELILWLLILLLCMSLLLAMPVISAVAAVMNCSATGQLEWLVDWACQRCGVAGASGGATAPTGLVQKEPE
jgi:hypothetical protein